MVIFSHDVAPTMIRFGPNLERGPGLSILIRSRVSNANVRFPLDNLKIMAPKSKGSTRIDAGKVSCQYCGNNFASRGIASHERSCKFKPRETSASEKVFEDRVRREGLLCRRNSVPFGHLDYLSIK